jgi:hypothetical protein
VADVPKNSQTIQIEGIRARAPVSELQLQQIGGAINYILGFANIVGVQTFSSSGTSQAPLGANAAILIGWGGGGGGGSGGVGVSANLASGGGGGGGAPFGVKYITGLTPLANYDVVIGAGGAGGAAVGPSEANGNAGSAGGTTGFGPAFQHPFYGGAGGGGGRFGDSTNVAASSVSDRFGSQNGGRSGFIVSSAGTEADTGQWSPFAQGGAIGARAGGLSVNNIGASGGGGAGATSGGGSGGTSTTTSAGGVATAGQNGTANSGAGGGGGGAFGNNTSSGVSGAGGSGGSGFLIVFYLSV